MPMKMPLTPQDSYTHRTDSGRQLTFADQAAGRSTTRAGQAACPGFSADFPPICPRSQDSPECIADLGAAQSTVEG